MEIGFGKRKAHKMSYGLSCELTFETYGTSCVLGVGDETLQFILFTIQV